MKFKKYKIKLPYLLLSSLVAGVSILGATSACIYLSKNNSFIDNSVPKNDQNIDISNQNNLTNLVSNTKVINDTTKQNSNVIINDKLELKDVNRQIPITGMTSIARTRINLEEYPGIPRKFDAYTQKSQVQKFLIDWQSAAWNNNQAKLPLIFNNCDSKLMNKSFTVIDVRMNPLTDITYAYVRLSQSYDNNGNITNKPISTIIEIANSVEEYKYDPFTPTLMTNHGLLKPYDGKFLWWNDNYNNNTFSSLKAELYSMEFNSLTNKYVQLFTNKDHALAIGLTSNPYERPTQVVEFNGFKDPKNNFDYAFSNNMKMIPITDEFGITNEYLIFPAGPLGYTNEQKWRNYVYRFKIDPNNPKGGELSPFNFGSTDQINKSDIAINAMGIRKIISSPVAYYLVALQLYNANTNSFKTIYTCFKDELNQDGVLYNWTTYQPMAQLPLERNSLLQKAYNWNYNSNYDTVPSLVIPNKTKQSDFRHYLITDATPVWIPLEINNVSFDNEILNISFETTCINPTFEDTNFNVFSITNNATYSINYQINGYFDFKQGIDDSYKNIFEPFKDQSNVQSNAYKFYPFNPIFEKSGIDGDYVKLYIANQKDVHKLKYSEFKESILPWPMGITFSNDQSKILINTLKCVEKHNTVKSESLDDCALTSTGLYLENTYSKNTPFTERIKVIFGGTANNTNNDALFSSTDNILYPTTTYSSNVSQLEENVNEDPNYEPEMDIIYFEDLIPDPLLIEKAPPERIIQAYNDVNDPNHDIVVAALARTLKNNANKINEKLKFLKSEGGSKDQFKLKNVKLPFDVEAAVNNGTFKVTKLALDPRNKGKLAMRLHFPFYWVAQDCFCASSFVGAEGSDDQNSKEYTQYRARTFYFDAINSDIKTISAQRWSRSGDTVTFSQNNLVSDFYVEENTNKVRKLDFSPKNFNNRPNGYSNFFYNSDTNVNLLLNKQEQYKNLLENYFTKSDNDLEFLYLLYSLHGLLINWKTADMAEQFDNNFDFPYALNLMFNVLYNLEYASSNNLYLVAKDYYNGKWRDWQYEPGNNNQPWRFPGMLDANNKSYPKEIYQKFIEQYNRFFYINEDSVTWTKDGILRYSVTYPYTIDNEFDIVKDDSIIIEIKISSSWNYVELTANQQYWESVNSSLDAVNRKIKEINKLKTSLEIYNANIFNTNNMVQIIVPGSFELIDYNPSSKIGTFACDYYFNFDNNDQKGIIAPAKTTALIEFMTGGESSGPIGTPDLPKEINIKGSEFVNMNASLLVNEMNANSAVWTKFKKYAAEKIISEMKKQDQSFDITVNEIVFNTIQEFNYSKGYITFNISIPSLDNVIKYQSATIKFDGFTKINPTNINYIAKQSNVNKDVISRIKPSKLQAFLDEQWWHIFYFIDATNDVGKEQAPWKPYILGTDASGNPTYVKNPSFNETEVNGYDQNKISEIAKTNTMIKAIVNSYNDKEGTADVSLFVQNLYVNDNNVMLDGNLPTPYITKMFSIKFTNLESDGNKVLTSVPEIVNFNTNKPNLDENVACNVSNDKLAQDIFSVMKELPSGVNFSDIEFISRINNNKKGEIYVEFKLPVVKDTNNQANSTLAKDIIFKTTIVNLTKVNSPTTVEIVNQTTTPPELLAPNGIVEWSQKWFNNDGSLKQGINPNDLMKHLVKISPLPIFDSNNVNRIKLVNVNTSLNAATINYAIAKYYKNDQYYSLASNLELQLDIEVYKNSIKVTRIIIQGNDVNNQPIEIINYELLNEINNRSSSSNVNIVLIATLVPISVLVMLLLGWYLFRKFK